MSDNKRIAKNTVALFIRMCFIAILGLVSSRYMLKYLGEVEFGIYNVVGGAVNLMGFFNIVLASATNRFLMTELGKGENTNISKVFSTSLQIHAAISLIVILLGETIGLYYIDHFLNVPPSYMHDVHIIFQISLFACAVCVLQVPYQGLLISFENFTRFSIVQVLMMFGILFASLAVGLFDDARLVWFSLFMAASQVAGFLLYALLSRTYVPKILWRADKGLIKEMLGFSCWIALGAASSMGKNQGSNIILNYFFGPMVNTAFSIGNQINAQISKLTENVSKSFSPQIMKSYTSNDFERMISLVGASSKYSFFILYLVAFPFFIKVEYILRLWLGSYPDYTVTFCNIIMINALLGSLAQGIYPAIQATGKIKWFQIVGAILTLSTIPLAIFTFYFGAPPYLISIAFFSTSFFGVFTSYYMMHRILNFPIRSIFNAIYLKVLPVLAVTSPFILILRLWLADTIIGLVMTVIFTSLILSLAVFILGLNTTERQNIVAFIKHKVK